jgi:transposase InsO family protein
MTSKHEKGKTPRKHEHLSPLEVQAIADARARGAKVASLAQQHGVSRQTIYNAIRAVKGEVDSSTGERASKSPPTKRHRAKRILPEVEKRIADMKRKYPTWGVDYLRRQWEKAGNQRLSRSSVYRILRDAGLQSRHLVEKEVYHRFEMTRPGQLWQMDIEGKLHLDGIGWVYGYSILDDFSRFCPAFRYFPDETLSNGVLTLNDAIGKYGVPEAIYVDNGSQFRSHGERMNNFELFCAAYTIKVISSTPYRPEGKGKVERLYETVENQFIIWVRAKLKDDPNYSLAQLNRDLETYLQEEYHAHVHSMTQETPSARFARGPLRIPNPPVDVTKYLERTMSRRVNKFGEISYNGYKIQVELPARTRVIVVETIETIRVEYGSGLVREINKRDLTKDLPVKRQNGVLDREHEQPAMKDDTKVTKKESRRKREHHAHGPDANGYFHRRINHGGNVKVQSISFYIGQALAGKNVLLKIVGNQLNVLDEEQHPISNIEISRGRKY